MLDPVDLLVTDPVTGRSTGLAKTVRRALAAMARSGAPHCVLGATALAVRGLPRMDLVVLVDDAKHAIAALRAAGLRASTPVGSRDNPESMIVDPITDVDVDLLVAAGDPEAAVIEEAPRAKVFGRM